MVRPNRRDRRSNMVRSYVRRSNIRETLEELEKELFLRNWYAGDDDSITPRLLEQATEEFRSLRKKLEEAEKRQSERRKFEHGQISKELKELENFQDPLYDRWLSVEYRSQTRNKNNDSQVEPLDVELDWGTDQEQQMVLDWAIDLTELVAARTRKNTSLLKKHMGRSRGSRG